MLRQILAASLLALACVSPGRAEQTDVKVSKGFGILYLPLMVVEDQKLFEKHAKRLGAGDLHVTWLTIDGGTAINDAMISGNLQYAGIGIPGFVTLWSKGKGTPREAIGVSGLSRSALLLNTRNPSVKSLKDFGPNDRIALPGIKTSLSALILEMGAAKEFGDANYAKLDALTVALGHPDAYAALISGKGEIDAHFGSPPYSNLELETAGIHTVFNSTSVLGDSSVDVVYSTRAFADANPKVTQALVDALDEANAYIRRNKRGAAEAYLRVSQTKTTLDEILRMLDDPDTAFSTTPRGSMLFANFMAKAGIITAKPASWKDLFVPYVQRRKGS
ncbi:MAG: ABC transporter substrate-binding protein [Candidatus Eremiobacteraeota bacterium]|nr:ABC transporter substrate-binding protein [Candidatus Eremiobacteraeota bacterium]